MICIVSIFSTTLIPNRKVLSSASSGVEPDEMNCCYVILPNSPVLFYVRKKVTVFGRFTWKLPLFLWLWQRSVHADGGSHEEKGPPLLVSYPLILTGAHPGFSLGRGLPLSLIYESLILGSGFWSYCGFAGIGMVRRETILTRLSSELSRSGRTR